MYHFFLIHSSISRHLDCFHVLAAVNSAAMNIWVHVTFWIGILSKYMPRGGIVRSYGSSVFWGSSILFSIVVVPIYIPTNSVGVFPFLHTLSSIVICQLINDTILSIVGWYFIVDLIWISLIISYVEHSFMCPLAALVVSGFDIRVIVTS